MSAPMFRWLHLSMKCGKHLPKCTQSKHLPTCTQAVHYQRPSRRQFLEKDDGGLKPGRNVVEEIEDRLVGRDGGIPRDVMREDGKLRLTVKYKTIQRKHFKEPTEANLLTWDAKNQIRYLLKEYPESWTIDRITESFPITRKGVIKLLQSTWMPHSEKEVLIHDRRVKKHWLLLTSGDASGPVSLLYQQLAADGKWDLITNAAGIRHLPKPEHRVFLSGGTHEVERQVGKFEMIVKDYCEQERLEEGMQTSCSKVNQREEIEGRDGDETNSLLLAISNLWKEKYGSTITSEAHEQASSYISKMKRENLSVESTPHKDKALSNDFGMDKFKNSLMSNEETSWFETDVDFTDVNMKSGSEDDGLAEIKPRHRSRHLRRRVRSKVNMLAYDPELYALKDTEKVKSKEVSSEPLYEKMKRNEVQENILKNVKFSQQGALDNVEEPYLYDAYRGYQHPFGKYDPVAEGIKVDRSVRKQKLYRKGDVFYAKDGEFLFKVP